MVPRVDGISVHGNFGEEIVKEAEKAWVAYTEGLLEP